MNSFLAHHDVLLLCMLEGRLFQQYQQWSNYKLSASFIKVASLLGLRLCVQSISQKTLTSGAFFYTLIFVKSLKCQEHYLNLEVTGLRTVHSLSNQIYSDNTKEQQVLIDQKAVMETVLDYGQFLLNKHEFIT